MPILLIWKSALGPIRDNAKNKKNKILLKQKCNSKVLDLYGPKYIWDVSMCFSKYSPHRNVFMPCGKSI